eukprot:1162070-Pelagomonas_calceolata.AAC.12
MKEGTWCTLDKKAHGEASLCLHTAGLHVHGNDAERCVMAHCKTGCSVEIAARGSVNFESGKHAMKQAKLPISCSFINPQSQGQHACELAHKLQADQRGNKNDLSKKEKADFAYRRCALKGAHQEETLQAVLKIAEPHPLKTSTCIVSCASCKYKCIHKQPSCVSLLRIRVLREIEFPQ